MRTRTISYQITEAAGTDRRSIRRYHVTLITDPGHHVGGDLLFSEEDALFVAAMLNDGCTSPAFNAILDGWSSTPVVIH